MKIEITNKKIVIHGHTFDLSQLENMHQTLFIENGCVEVDETGCVRTKSACGQFEYWPELPGLRELENDYMERLEDSILGRNNAME